MNFKYFQTARAGLVLALTVLALVVFWLLPDKIILATLPAKPSSNDILALATQLGNRVLWAVVIIIFAFLIAERLVDVFAAILEDRERGEAQDGLSKLPSLITAAHDILSFPTNSAACDFCIYAIQNANHVRNTVLRYGHHRTELTTDSAYERWVIAKSQAIRGGIPFKELVSAHLIDNDIQMQLMRVLKETESHTNYEPLFLNDIANPMLQLSHFERAKDHGGNIVIFGWYFPEKEHGPTFASSNPDIVSYFYNYFEYHYKNMANQTRSGALTTELRSKP